MNDRNWPKYWTIWSMHWHSQWTIRLDLLKCFFPIRRFSGYWICGVQLMQVNETFCYIHLPVMSSVCLSFFFMLQWIQKFPALYSRCGFGGINPCGFIAQFLSRYIYYLMWWDICTSKFHSLTHFRFHGTLIAELLKHSCLWYSSTWYSSTWCADSPCGNSNSLSDTVRCLLPFKV